MSDREIVVGIAGASGAQLARKFVELALTAPELSRLHLVISQSALAVAREELDRAIGSSRDWLSTLSSPRKAAAKVRLYGNENVGAQIASGSYPTAGMIVIPCSMGTLARVAHGLAGNLIDRAADVCLKEKRPLVLCTRETPLNRVHIHNMDTAAEAGATIYPLIPTFYNLPKSFDEMAHQFACRVLQFVGLEQKDAYRWKG